MAPEISLERKKSRSFIYSGITFILGVLITFFALNVKHLQEPNNSTAQQTYAINRIQGYKYIKPILVVEPLTESIKLKGLKATLVNLIDSLKSVGYADDVTVYFRGFRHGGWISINPEKTYHPASLMKVALMLCYLREAEAIPHMLEQKFLFEKPSNVEINAQYYPTKGIEPGKSYTIHELLFYMIANSDNNATFLLASHFDPNKLKKLFRDFGMPEPIMDETKFTISAKQYSYFFSAIFNSSILSPEYSEYAAELLSKSTFQEGFGKGFPPGTEMWHKFGEWRNAGQPYELHEAGVFYWHGIPLMLTVMTKGNDTEKLAATIRAIADRTYKNIPQP